MDKINYDFKYLKPFKWFVLQNFPFIDEDFDAITNYQLFCKLGEEINKIINSQNQLGTQVENLTNAYNSLYDYVENYFENLDVQDEINNKLDQMAEDGSLERIVAQYLSKKPYYFETVAQMKAYELEDGDMAITSGFYEINDGGGAIYFITNTASLTNYNFKINNNLYAEILVNDTINIKQLGAKGINAPLSTLFSTTAEAQNFYPSVNSLTELIDGAVIQTAINYFSNIIFIPKGTFYTNRQINITSDRIHILGVNKNTSTIQYITNGLEENEVSILYFGSSTNRSIIENINFISNYESTTDTSVFSDYKLNGITLDHSSYNLIKNCRFFQMLNGVKIIYSWCNDIEDSYIARCHYGINGNSSAVNDTKISNCQVEYNYLGIYFGEGRTQTIYNCDFENNGYYSVIKTNEGDMQILNSYFEDKLKISWGQTYPSNILISGCSFFQNPATTDDAYVPIEYHGAEDITQVTIINCNFKNNSQNSDTYETLCITQNNNLTTVKPTLIGNSVLNMKLFNPARFKGVNIKNGIIEDYRFPKYATSYINTADGGAKTLTLSDSKHYRVNIGASGTYTIKLPTIDNPYLNYEYDFIVGGNNTSDKLLIVNIEGVNSSVNVYGNDKTLSYSDVNKLIRCIYIGNFNNKDQWEVIK